MNKRSFVTGLVVLAILAGLFFWLRRPSAPELELSDLSSTETQVEESFGVEIPEDFEKVALKDVVGGNSTGLATRKFENGKFTHMVLADLPDPEEGKFYEGWLVRGKPSDANFHFVSTGRMRIAKGGFVLDFESTTDYTDHKGVIITLEEIFDNTPEEHILEGSF